MDSSMRIALFLPNWIGDVVMATPAIRAVRQDYPDAELIGVCKPYVRGLLDGAPWFDTLLSFDKNGPREQRFRSVSRQLSAKPLDLAILFPNSFRVALLAWWAGAKKRIGFSRYGRRWLLSDRLEPIRDRRGRFKPSPIIDDYNRLLSPLKLPDPGYRMELFTTPQDELAADRIWQQFRLHTAREVIGLNPGAAFGAAKHWPVESFARLAQQLIDSRGSSILVFCGPNERETARQIVQQTGRSQVHSLADQEVSLGLSKASVRRLDLLVTTDSGPRHFAAAFDRPVVSLFGPTFREWTITYFEKEICLQKQVPCGPCQQRTCPLDHRCMKELGVEEVLQAGVSLLHAFPNRGRYRDAV
jgi:heptosyltransferase-2